MMRHSKNTTCLIVGFGSIGARHAGILRTLGYEVSVVSRRNDIPFPIYPGIAPALREVQPGLVVIANKTHEHLAACLELEALGYSGVALVEKPLGDHLPEKKFAPSYQAYIAYNLRFHPLIRRIRELLGTRRVFSAQFSVGQYLPDWRPGTDYRQCYSARSDQGGGVLRDLSHELDLALWLFGPWLSVASRIGKWGNLDIFAEDTVDILGECENCRSLTIHLDYHSHVSQRHILVQADGISLYADLLSGALRTGEDAEHVAFERNTSFIAQMEAVVSGDGASLCRWDEGLAVMRFLEAVEKAARLRSWEVSA